MLLKGNSKNETLQMRKGDSVTTVLWLYKGLRTCDITKARQSPANGRCEIQIAHYCWELGSFDLQIVIAFIIIVTELLFFWIPKRGIFFPLYFIFYKLVEMKEKYSSSLGDRPSSGYCKLSLSLNWWWSVNMCFNPQAILTCVSAASTRMLLFSTMVDSCNNLLHSQMWNVKQTTIAIF